MQLQTTRIGRRFIATMGMSAAIVGAFSARAGDFNGDGFEDLAIGVPLEDVGAVVDAGCVNIVYGAPPGLIASPGAGAIVAGQMWNQNTGLPDVAEPGDNFGFALASGDIDADGFDDLVIGVPGEIIGGMPAAGAIHIMYGGPAGLLPAGSVFLTQAFFGEPVEPGDNFGYAVAVGDVNGDGVDDVIVSAPLEDLGAIVDTGMVHVLFGVGGGGVVPGGLPIMVQSMAGFGEISEPGDGFGRALACGNFDADPFEDVLIGVPGEDLPGGGPVDAGMIHAVPGGPGGLMPGAGPTPFLIQAMLPTGDPSEPGDAFGFSLATGDIDADGDDDAVVGAPTEDIVAVDAGAITVIAGTAGVGLTPAPAMFIPQGMFGIDVSEPFDNFGRAVAVADFNFDGFADIAAGRPMEDLGAMVDAGEITVIPGGPGGPGTGPVPTEWSQDSPGIVEIAAPGDMLGFALGTGDFDGDGFADLAIGVPSEDVGAGAAGVGAGCINVLYGFPVGLTAAGDQQWHQSSAGVPEAVGAGDALGLAIAPR